MLTLTCSANTNNTCTTWTVQLDGAATSSLPIDTGYFQTVGTDLMLQAFSAGFSLFIGFWALGFFGGVIVSTIRKMF